MLKADAVNGVVEFDIDPEIVAVEFERVARAQACRFVKVC